MKQKIELLDIRFPVEFTEKSIVKTIGALSFDWGLILASVYLSVSLKLLPLYIFSVFLIASRQHALFLMMHEGAHFQFCQSKRWNNILSSVLASWPIALSTCRFREHHWSHHKFLNTDMDPDWARKKANPRWHYPKETHRFWADFLPYFRGLGVTEMFFAIKLIGPQKKELCLFLFYWATIATAFTITSGWQIFALYWLVPYFSVLPILNKVRSIVEHLALPNTRSLNAARNICGSPIESFFFGPHENSLHLIHHLRPSVPWHKISLARQYLIEHSEEYRKNAYENRGYFLPGKNSVLSDLTKSREESKNEISGKYAA